MKPRKIALFYGHVASNIGDLAINRGEVCLLKAAFPGAAIHVVLLDAEKNEFLQQAKSSFGNDRPILFSYLHANYEKALLFHAHPEQLLRDCGVDDADLIVLASGEHLFAYSRPENEKAVFWRTLPALAAKGCNKPCVLLPSTFGPFEDPKSSELISSFLSLVDSFAARDTYSARNLHTQFTLDSFPTLLDPAFFLDLTRLSHSTGDFEAGGGKTVLGLSMRSEGWGIRLSKEQRERLSDSFDSNSFKNSIAFQFSVTLASEFLKRDPAAHVHLFVQTSVDEVLAHHIKKSLSAFGYDERIRLIKPVSVQDYIAHLIQADFVVASRFHAIVLSLVVNKPVFGVYFDSHGHKMPGMFEFFGVPNECINLSTVSPEIAAQSALQAIAQKKDIWPNVQQRVAELKEHTVCWLSRYQNKFPDSKIFWNAIGAFGDVAFSLARNGFDANKKQGMQGLQKELTGLKAKYSEVQENFRQTQHKEQAHVQEFERQLNEARRQAEAEALMLKAQIASLEQQHAESQESFRQAQENWQAQVQEFERQLNEARRQAEAEALMLKAQIASLEQQHAESQESFRKAQENWQAQVQEHERQLDETRRQAEAEALMLKSQIKSLDQQHTKTKKLLQQDSTRAVRRAEERIKGHLSYRLGKALVDSPNVLRWPAVPFKLYCAWKEYKNDKAAIALVTASALPGEPPKPETTAAIDLAAASGLPADPPKPETNSTVGTPGNPNNSLPVFLNTESISSAFERNGLQAAIELVDNLNKREPHRARAMALIRAGKALWDLGHEEAEFSFAQKALKVDRSEPVLRAFFWAAQRAQAYLHSCDTILEIEKLYGNKPTEAQQELLQKLKAAPAYQLSALKEATPSRVSKISSIPDRICYVLHNTLPYSSGGYATRSHGVTTGLKKAGWDMVVLSRPGFPLDIKPELAEPDIPSMDIIDSIPYIRTLSPKRVGMTALEYMLASADAIEAKIREHKPAVVMAASNHVTGLPALIAARRAGLPLIYEIRGLWEITRMSRDNGFQDKAAFHVQKILEASLANMADHVFTLTEGMRQELVERGVPQSKMNLLPNCCDPTRFQPIDKDERLSSTLGIPAGVPVIGYIGTFVDYEGLEDLAEACALLKQRGVEFRLLMVGNENASGQGRGPISERIVQIAEGQQFSDWLIMPGRVPHEEVENYYSLIDIAPFPRKPWPVCEMVSPMKPLEALAMEKAVVVSSVRALVDMIEHERTGLVFVKGDINSLAFTLNRLIDSPDLRKALGEQGRKWVQQQRTWDQIGDQASKVIYPLMKNYIN